MSLYPIIIAGSRDIKNYHLVAINLDKLIPQENRDKIEIVSGCAQGVDQMGELWAKANNIPVVPFPADWDGLGKRAGYVRNEAMAKYSKCLIAFWDGQSKGTKHMIDLANKHNLIVKVVTL